MVWYCIICCKSYESKFCISEWVVGHWEEPGCDLWEEVTSDDFFWNRMAFIYCLNVAADYSDRIGQSMGDTYRSTAEDIKAVITKHWNGDYLYESTNRPDDGATIHAITTFAKEFYTPDSEEAAATIRQENINESDK